ncbi:DUF1376 domain-containing protein [Erythrobacter sp. SG61-1L]|uniref:DUF1376 domain-containing protein n=1 Tax=Erythrobacter sp. SG61-1L TaxID=1603897 RepID=UPI0006C9149D|nr:DUF1376 domain-containing protein [Erythrobacter sp. SG61-1L]
MGQIKWYKRDPDAALNGMMELTLEERGAYNTVLDLIYTRDGNLPDDDHFIAGWCRVDLRVWKRIKKVLMERGKLYIRDGQIRNSKADVEVTNALSRVGSARDAGLSSARSKSRKSKPDDRKNSNLGSTGVATDASTTVSTNHNHNHIEDTNVSSPPISPTKKSRGKDWPEIPEWIPTEPWNGFIEMRKRFGKMPTARAAKMLIGKLDELRTSGCDPGAVLDQSTLKNWTDVYPLKDRNNGTGQSSRYDNRDGFEIALDNRIAARRAAGASEALE